ncbi:MAG: flavin-containing monooxygenase [Pseudorhodoplanes sp.]|uniref:flavin-containing monooxygenase n=1 Tax=Pseudorhodoplanes sp. TaxID=1934341 RepID=UPI003D0FFF3B
MAAIPPTSRSDLNNLGPHLLDETRLRSALEETDIVPQLMVYTQITGDLSLLEKAKPFIKGAWDYQVEIPAGLQASIRDALVSALKRFEDRKTPVPVPSPALFGAIMNTATGVTLPDEYLPLFMEEMGDVPGFSRTVPWRAPPGKDVLERFKVIIVGAGLSGICMGIKLLEAGIPFVIYEKNDAVGGTWYENAYPGAGVDIPNHFYSFSFKLKHDWSRHFAKRDELWSYLKQCVADYGLDRHIVFNAEVTTATFDETQSIWAVTVRHGNQTETVDRGNVFVTATGQLNRPKVPDIPGMDTFEGASFHTARWPAGEKLDGRRVALIGTGASSMQVAPSIANKVAKLLIFQRTPCWAALHPNYQRSVPDGMQWAFKHVPYLAQWYRLLLFWAAGDGLHASLQVDPDWPMPELSVSAENHKLRESLVEHIRRELKDRIDLIEKVIPSYPPYTKRMLRDNNWYQTLQRQNVELVNAGVARISGNSIIDETGAAHEADVIVFATGFHSNRLLWPMSIKGRDGRVIEDMWDRDDPRAFLGITVPGFPNFFILYGPNTNLSHGGSIFFHAELQVRYVMQALRDMIEKDLASVECRQDRFDTYNDSVDEAHSRMVWAHKGANSWYRNRRGRVVANSPWRLVDYWRLTAAFNPDDYTIRKAD